jgi:hypothetical protein
LRDQTHRPRLAERGTYLSSGKLWVREVRRLDASGHQTSILSTDYTSDIRRCAAAMFAKWHQENFFKYMGEHYGLDRLVQQGTSPLPDTTKLVNPAWRKIESQVRSKIGQLNRQRALFTQHNLKPHEDTPEKAAQYEQRKGSLLATVQTLEEEVRTLKAQRKEHPHHITLAELPEGQRLEQLAPARKQFMDSIKLIAYRAESSLVELAREKLQRHDDARSFERGLFKTTINLRPELNKKQLVVELHGQTNPMHDMVVEHLCSELNETETTYPGTDLTLVFQTIRSSTFHAGQDV